MKTPAQIKSRLVVDPVIVTITAEDVKSILWWRGDCAHVKLQDGRTVSIDTTTRTDERFMSAVAARLERD